jgi:hypothetical protein
MSRSVRLSDLSWTAAVALVAGLVGGVGGRRFANRVLSQDLGDLADQVEQLDRRLSRREGRDGAETKRRAKDDLEDRVAALAEQERSGQRGPQPLTREALTALGPRVFGVPGHE